MPSDPSSGSSDLDFWTALAKCTRGSRGRLIGSGVCALVVGATVALQPLCLSWIIDHGLLTTGDADARLRSTLSYVALFAGLSALRMTIGLSGTRLLSYGVENVLAGLRARLFRHIQHLCVRFHDRNPSGELYSYIMGSPLTSLKQFLHQAALMIPIQAVSWTIALVALSSFSAPMTGITLVIVLTIVLVNHRSRRMVTAMSRDAMQAESNLSRYVADTLTGSRAIKTYAIEDDVSYAFDDHIARFRTLGARLAWGQAFENGKVEALQYAGVAVIYAAGSWYVIRGELQIGEFIAFVTSINLLMAPLLTLLSLNLIRGNAIAGLERITRVLATAQTTPELDAANRMSLAAAGAAARAAGTPAIEWRDVHFAYDGGKPVFAGLSCRIPEGQSVALVGASGSGKTSFVSLLMRFYDPQAGAILVDGVDIRHASLKELRGRFGVVPQDPFVFQGTMRENLAVVRPGATSAEIDQAIERARLGPVVADLPQGLETRLGEGGMGLSGGQRQRLAIARAILCQPRCFIFDEATSALDNESEHHVQHALAHLMRDTTTLIIAHRLSTIRHVDRILVFDGGRIVQDGSWSDLSAVDGPFRALLSYGEVVDGVPARRANADGQP